MGKRAFEKTLASMQQAGLYDNNKNALKTSQEEADNLFEIYFEAYLNREKQLLVNESAFNYGNKFLDKIIK